MKGYKLYIDNEGVKRGYYVYLHKSKKDGEVVVLEDIRNIDGSLLDVNFSCSMIFRVYRMITEKYVPSEAKQFSLKYIQDWREQYHKVK